MVISKPDALRWLRSLHDHYDGERLSCHQKILAGEYSTTTAEEYIRYSYEAAALKLAITTIEGEQSAST